MSNRLEILFCDNPNLDSQIADFLAHDPEFVRAEHEFYETAQEIAQVIGFDQYDTFERRLGAYMARFAGLHYLFGLGLRQEVLQAMGAGG